MEAADWIAPIVGCLGGIVLGLAARIGRFCSLGAIEDATFGAGMTRLSTWGLAMAVAILGTSVLDLFDVLRLDELFYLSRPALIGSTIFGGLSFGLGMALVGTCAFGSLARLGGGDLSGLIVALIVGMTGYIASSGAIGVLRAVYLPVSEAELHQSGIAHAIANAFNLSPPVVAILIGGALLAIMVILLRSDKSAMFWGGVVGLVIVSGWAATAWHSETNFGETGINSHSYVRPIGDSMIYAMISSGATFSFAVASVIGVVIGATFGALAKKEFRWEACDDARTLKRQIVGASLMGVGGVFSLGCTVGQGLSAASVLAVSAPVAILSIMIGAWLGLQWMVHGSVLESVRSLIQPR